MQTISKRILVTGGAGFLGSHLCERLLARGHNILCVDTAWPRLSSKPSSATLSASARSRIAAAARALIDSWVEDYNTVHPHSRLGYRSPREYIIMLSQPAACPV
jgi:nucleoside-diphosphate-sugar epimerase